MSTFSKQLLSGSTDGQPIPVAATATPGTLIHTAAAAGTLDEVWIYAVNTNSGNDRELTLEFGGVTAADQIFIRVKRRAGAVLVVSGIITNAKLIRAFSSAANDINVFGFVNRISP